MAEDMKECPFCAKAIYCRFCQHYLDGREQPTPGDDVGGDKISAGDLIDVKGTAVGRESQAASVGDVEGTFIQAQGDVQLGKELRDEQYEIVQNWEAHGKPLMRGFDLSGRDLANLDLAGADLRNAIMIRADLSQTDLNEACLFRADLSEADLEWTILDGASLIGAKLCRANLFNANLIGANLAGADLTEAKLDYADLSGAELIRANLCGATLIGTARDENTILTGLTTGMDGVEPTDEEIRANLIENGARYNKHTVWHVNFDPIIDGAVLVDEMGNPIKDSE